MLRDLRLEGPYTMRPATAEDKSRNKYGENDVSGTMGAEEDLRVPAPNTVSSETRQANDPSLLRILQAP